MPLKVLAVDDSQTMRKIYEMTFRSSEFEIQTVSNATEAVAQTGSWSPDVVLADVSMTPNGYDLAKQLRDQLGPSRPFVIVMTSQQRAYDPEKGRSADDHLSKPFDTQTLIDKVKEVTSKSKQLSYVGPFPTRGSQVGPLPTAMGQNAPGFTAAGPTALGQRTLGAFSVGSNTGLRNSSVPGPLPSTSLSGMGALPAQPSNMQPSNMQPSPGKPPSSLSQLSQTQVQVPNTASAPFASTPGSVSTKNPMRSTMAFGAVASPSLFPPKPPATGTSPTLPRKDATEPFAFSKPVPTQAVQPFDAKPAYNPLNATPSADPSSAGASNTSFNAQLDAMGLSASQKDEVLSLIKTTVEKTVWEVVPALAETMIREELQRLTRV